jgi:hypothetical protein
MTLLVGSLKILVVKDLFLKTIFFGKDTLIDNIFI